MGLKDIAQKIVLSHKEKTLGQEFEYFYYKTVMIEHPPRPVKVDMFSPSSLNKCSREIYYRIMGTFPEPRTGTPEYLLASWTAITDNGTDRHERIQTTITRMKESGWDIEWLDVAKFVAMTKPVGTEVAGVDTRYMDANNPTPAEVTDYNKRLQADKDNMETKLYSSILSARFLCDGVVRIKDKYYLIEIKTMNARKWAKAEQQGTMLVEHLEQAAAYSIALNISDILYIYENRDNSQIRVYERHVRDEHKKAVLNKIHTIQTYKQNGQIPPKTLDLNKCTFCDYKKKCVVDGFTPNLFPTVKVTIDE